MFYIARIIAKISQALIFVPCRVIFRWFFRLKILGQEYIRDLKGPYIIASNHDSYVDPFLIADAYPFGLKYYPFWFVAERRLFFRPHIALPIFILGARPIIKGIGLNHATKKFAKILDKGGHIVIFPRGKKSTIGRPAVPKRGVAYLASRCDCPIVPVYIKGLFDLRLSDVVHRRRHVTIRYGKPLTIKELTSKKLRTKKDLAIVAKGVMARVMDLRHSV